MYGTGTTLLGIPSTGVRLDFLALSCVLEGRALRPRGIDACAHAYVTSRILQSQLALAPCPSSVTLWRRAAAAAGGGYGWIARAAAAHVAMS